MMKTTLIAVLFAFACGGGGKKEETKPDPNPTPTETTAKTDATTPPATTEESMPAPPPEPTPDPKAEALAAEMAAFENAKPVFEKACKSCHFKGEKAATKKKLEEFDITTYPFGGKHNTGADVKKVLGIGGGKATMPKNKPGSVKGDDLAAIEAWVTAYEAAEAAGAHAK